MSSQANSTTTSLLTNITTDTQLRTGIYDKLFDPVTCWYLWHSDDVTFQQMFGSELNAEICKVIQAAVSWALFPLHYILACILYAASCLVLVLYDVIVLLVLAMIGILVSIARSSYHIFNHLHFNLGNRHCWLILLFDA